MKRLTALLLSLSLFLSGCGVFGERIKEPVTFYYIRTDYQSDMTDIIASEEREASGHLDDLSYLIALYLMGPSDEALVSPIPPGTQISVAEHNENSVVLNMTDASKTLTDAEFSLACACLTLTCLDLTGAEEVTIRNNSRTVTMTRESLSLYDDSAEIAETAVTEESE